MGCNNLLEQLEQVKQNPRNYLQLGDFGEAVAEVLLHDVLDHEVIADLATRDGPQGVDLITYGPDGKITIAEVKSTGVEAPPHMRMNKDGTRQMDDHWTGDRARKAGLDAVADDHVSVGEVGKLVVHVDLLADQVTVRRVDGAGKVDHEAELTFALEDLVRFADAIRADEAA